MKVIRAKSAGFCWGVERAIKIARRLAAEGYQPVLTDGPLIHNKQMTDLLEAEGIREAGADLVAAGANHSAKDRSKTALVVRAHGITPERRTFLKSLNHPFYDATCPDVGTIAGRIRLFAKKGYATVIFGDAAHPEAIGLNGYAEGRGHIVQNPADLDRLPPLGDKVLFVAQSTMFTDDFAKMAGHLREKYPQLLVLDTICSATVQRQMEVGELAEGGAEAIVVVGGRHSANTLRLAALARRQNLPVYHVETAAELPAPEMRRYQTVGVTAGASTPAFLIDAVCQTLEAIH